MLTWAELLQQDKERVTAGSPAGEGHKTQKARTRCLLRARASRLPTLGTGCPSIPTCPAGPALQAGPGGAAHLPQQGHHLLGPGGHVLDAHGAEQLHQGLRGVARVDVVGPLGSRGRAAAGASPNPGPPEVRLHAPSPWCRPREEPRRPSLQCSRGGDPRGCQQAGKDAQGAWAWRTSCRGQRGLPCLGPSPGQVLGGPDEEVGRADGDLTRPPASGAPALAGPRQLRG